MATMNDLANLLGLEVGERFDARSTKFENLRYPGLAFIDEGFDDNDSEIRIEQLFNGEFIVVKKPFKPKIGENYYYAYGGIDGFDVYVGTFSNRQFDIMNVATGNCFKTQSDAEKYKEEILEKIRTIYKEMGLLEDEK